MINHSPKGGAGRGLYVTTTHLRNQVGHTANVAVCAWYIPDFQGEDVPFQQVDPVGYPCAEPGIAALQLQSNLYGYDASRSDLRERLVGAGRTR